MKRRKRKTTTCVSIERSGGGGAVAAAAVLPTHAHGASEDVITVIIRRSGYFGDAN